MMSTIVLDPVLGDAIRELEPADDINVSIARMALREVERGVAVYETVDANLSSQYDMTFEEFFQSDLMREPCFAVEQDYFDWELAVSQIKRLRQDSARLLRIARR